MPLPPLYFLHVWWARRPLTVSRAAILGSLLPAWSEEWPVPLRKKFPTREAYHRWFVNLIGIFGDPVAARRILFAAREQKVPVKNPYGYTRAFSYNPSRAHRAAGVAPDLIGPDSGGGSDKRSDTGRGVSETDGRRGQTRGT